MRTPQTLLSGAAALSSGGNDDPTDPYLTAFCYFFYFFNGLRELWAPELKEVRIGENALYGVAPRRVYVIQNIIAHRYLIDYCADEAD